MDGLKESKQAVAGEALTSLSGFAPPVLLAVGTRLATRAPQRNVNTVTTNVPGPQVALFAAGRRMLKAYPYVPLAGQVRVGVAIFSYDGQVNFGVTGDYDTAPDIDVLCEGIEARHGRTVGGRRSAGADLTAEPPKAASAVQNRTAGTEVQVRADRAAAVARPGACRAPAGARGSRR